MQGTKVVQRQNTYDIKWVNPNGETISRYVKGHSNEAAIGAFYHGKVRPKLHKSPRAFGISWEDFKAIVGTRRLSVNLHTQREPEYVLDLGA